MNRRRVRRYRSHRGNSGVKFLGIVGIMVIAVICGYMTARFVIAPLLGYDTEVLKLDFPSRLADVFRNDADGNDEDSQEAGSEDNDSEDEDKGDEGEDKEDTDGDTAKNAEKDSGYALQFGLFSTEKRARELADKLDKEGIDAQVREMDDGQYKVISPLVDTKDEALETLKNTESKNVDDIFITKI